MMKKQYFVNPSGQRTNLGDSVLRREYLNGLRRHGELHVLARGADDYLSGLGIRPEDVTYTSALQWYRKAVAAIVRGRARYAINAGEIVADTPMVKWTVWQLPMLLAGAVSGNRAVASGISIRAVPARAVGVLRVMLRMTRLLIWRDAWSAGLNGRGTVAPDWAFAVVSEAAEVVEGRDYLAVCFRGDKQLLEASVLATVRTAARDLDLEPVVVVQVQEDEQRAVELAAALGARVVGWHVGSHREHEELVRSVYRRSAAVFSDRIHALIIGMTEGAVPIGTAPVDAEKIERTFATVTDRRIAYAVREFSADPALLRRLIEDNLWMIGALIDARKELDDTAAAIGACDAG